MSPDAVEFIRQMRALGATRVEAEGVTVVFGDMPLPAVEAPPSETTEERRKREAEEDERLLMWSADA